MDSISETELQTIISETACPYGSQAKLDTCVWSTENITDIKLQELSDGLRQMLNKGNDHMLLMIRDIQRHSLSEWIPWFRDLLIQLSPPSYLKDEKLLAPRWYLPFDNHAFFIAFFAPCYPEGHTRRSYHPETALVLFQEKSIFPHAQHPPLTAEAKAAMQTQVRKFFAAKGKEYDAAYSYWPTALRFIVPEYIGEPPIHWWDPSE